VCICRMHSHQLALIRRLRSLPYFRILSVSATLSPEVQAIYIELLD